MLNRGLADELIGFDEAVELLCAVMPKTFHKGNSTTPERGGLMVWHSTKRLVAWWNDGNESSPVEICDVVELLQGN